jgi:hypothetical protein
MINYNIKFKATAKRKENPISKLFESENKITEI